MNSLPPKDGLPPPPPPSPREELEARLTALALGEAGEFEAETLRARLAAEPDLAALYRQIQAAALAYKNTFEDERTHAHLPPLEQAPRHLSADRADRLAKLFASAGPTPSPAPAVKLVTPPAGRLSRKILPFPPQVQIFAAVACLVLVIGAYFVSSLSSTLGMSKNLLGHNAPIAVASAPVKAITDEKHGINTPFAGTPPATPMLAEADAVAPAQILSATQLANSVANTNTPTPSEPTASSLSSNWMNQDEQAKNNFLATNSLTISATASIQPTSDFAPPPPPSKPTILAGPPNEGAVVFANPVIIAGNGGPGGAAGGTGGRGGRGGRGGQGGRGGGQGGAPGYAANLAPAPAAAAAPPSGTANSYGLVPGAIQATTTDGAGSLGVIGGAGSLNFGGAAMRQGNLPADAGGLDLTTGNNARAANSLDDNSLLYLSAGTVNDVPVNRTYTGVGGIAKGALINSDLALAGVQTYQGPGDNPPTVILSGTNSFNGSVTLNSGTLTLGNDAALQNSTLHYTTGNGTLSFGNLSAATIGGLSANRDIQLGDGSISRGESWATGTTTDVSDQITGKFGGLQDNITPPHSYNITAGNLSVGGTLVLDGDWGSKSGGTLVDNGGSTVTVDTNLDRNALTPSSTEQYSESLTGAGSAPTNLQFQGGSLTFSGVVSGSGTLTKIGTGALTANSPGLDSLDTAGNNMATPFASYGNGTLVQAGAGTLTLSGTNNYTDALTGNANLTKSGTGTFTLDSSTYTGGTVISGGTLTFPTQVSPNQTAKQTGGYVITGGTLTITGSLGNTQSTLKQGVEQQLATAPVGAKDIADQPASRPPNAVTFPPPVATADNAFSTFALNVSDAAYQLAKAALLNHSWPDPASTRTEEFLNAFHYHDPAPATGEACALNYDLGQNPIESGDLLRVSFQTAAAGRDRTTPLRLTILLDDSGSMTRADRVATVQAALRALGSLLRPGDLVSLVTFSRTPQVRATSVAADHFSEILALTNSIEPEGGTNMEEALRTAYATARAQFDEHAQNRVILLTDGAANLGELDPAALAGIVEENRKAGIALDAYGVGWDGYDDTTLETLTRKSDGRYAFLNGPADVNAAFAAKLAGALAPAANDMKLQIEFNPKRVTSYRLMGYNNLRMTKEQFRDNTVNAGELAAADQGTALYNLAIDPTGAGPIGTARARYRDPGTTTYHEVSWTIQYNGLPPAFDQAPPALRLAAVAGYFAEYLQQSPYASGTTPRALLNLLHGVPEAFAPDTRPPGLAETLSAAATLAGN